MRIKQRNKIFDLWVPRSLAIMYVWGKGLGLFAGRNFKKGETVTCFRADIVPCAHASDESVQIDERRCFDTKWLTPEAFINHGCAPSTMLDVHGYRYVALRNIKKNEEITFDYLTTDWDLGRQAFRCRCGAKNCYGVVRGFKYLTHRQQERIKPHALPYLLEKIR